MRGYEVPGMNLLRDLRGAMRLDRSEDMSVHVSTCTSYDIDPLNVWSDGFVKRIEKGPELCPNGWILRHDNAPAHKVLSVKQAVSINKMEHLYYSSDLTSNDLWLFPKIKSALKGRRFQGTEDVKKM
jgi:hypothetical protein